MANEEAPSAETIFAEVDVRLTEQIATSEAKVQQLREEFITAEMRNMKTKADVEKLKRELESYGNLEAAQIELRTSLTETEKVAKEELRQVKEELNAVNEELERIKGEGIPIDPLNGIVEQMVKCSFNSAKQEENNEVKAMQEFRKKLMDGKSDLAELKVKNLCLGLQLENIEHPEIPLETREKTLMSAQATNQFLRKKLIAAKSKLRKVEVALGARGMREEDSTDQL